MLKPYPRAFTLIELLVVIAIIGILTSIIITNLASSRSRARDARRISDMGQIQLALTLYYDRCKQYPAASGGAVSMDSCQSGAVPLSNYISQIPTPPSSPLNQTKYDYSTSGPPPNNYVLHINLENSNEALKDGKQYNNGIGSYNCNDVGVSPYGYCLGPN